MISFSLNDQRRLQERQCPLPLREQVKQALITLPKRNEIHGQVNASKPSSHTELNTDDFESLPEIRQPLDKREEEIIGIPSDSDGDPSLQEQHSSGNQDNQGNPSRKILIEKWKSYIIEHIRNGTIGELWNGVAKSSPQVQAYFQDALQELSRQGESAKVYILESSSLQAGSSESHIQEFDLPLSTEQIEQYEQYEQRHKLLEAFRDPKKQEERQRSDQAGSSHWQKQKEIIEILSDSELDDNNTGKDWRAISIELNANEEGIKQIRQQFKKYKEMRKYSQDSTSDSGIARSFINSLPERYRQAYSDYRNQNVYSQEGQAIYHLWSEVYTTLPWEEDQKIVAEVHQKLDQREKEWLEKNKKLEEYNKQWNEMAQEHSEKQG